LDSARKHDHLIAAHQKQGYSDEDRAAFFAAWPEAYARECESGYRRLPESSL
jgi:hypothetical protein